MLILFQLYFLLFISCFVHSSVLEASSIFEGLDVEVVDAAPPLPFMELPCDEEARFCQPSFLIIGAGKSGTSSLYYYLQEHPQVEAAKMKQVQYFDHQFQRSADWYYRKHFPQSMPEGHVTGESSPGYIVYSAIPERVSSTVIMLFAYLTLCGCTIGDVVAATSEDSCDSEGAHRPHVVLLPLQLRRCHEGSRHCWPRELRTGDEIFTYIPPIYDFDVALSQVECDMLTKCFDRMRYDPRRGGQVAVDFVNDCFGAFPQTDHLKLIKRAHKVGLCNITSMFHTLPFILNIR